MYIQEYIYIYMDMNIKNTIATVKRRSKCFMTDSLFTSAGQWKETVLVSVGFAKQRLLATRGRGGGSKS